MLSLNILILVSPAIYGRVLEEKTDGRIANGKEALKNQFPFHVEIRHIRGELSCTYGGSILSEWHVLTAAATAAAEE